MELIFKTAPIAKARHRSRIVSNRIISYDPQTTDKMQAKYDAASQLRRAGIEPISEGPVYLSLSSFVPMPESWSMAKKKALNGTPCTSRPDFDNYIKFYCDVLNGIAYDDDRRITHSLTDKVYSFNPRVEISVIPIGVNMINEHAVTVKDEMNLEQLEYLVKKANKLGLQQRQIFRIYTQDDGEGKHIYFESESLKQKTDDDHPVHTV